MNELPGKYICKDIHNTQSQQSNNARLRLKTRDAVESNQSTQLLKFPLDKGEDAVVILARIGWMDGWINDTVSETDKELPGTFCSSVK